MVKRGTFERWRAISAIAVAIGIALAGSAGVASAEPIDRADDPRQVVLDIGNGATARIQPVSSEVTFTTPTPLTWDPRLARAFDKGFGGFYSGWSFGTPFLVGQMFYLPTHGRFFEWDAWAPSGLREYPWDDLRVDAARGELPARGDVPAQPYQWTIRHLDSNVIEYFDSENLVASVDTRTGARTDWLWHSGRDLDRIVDEAGRVTRVEEVDPAEYHFTMPDGETISVGLDGGLVSHIASASHRTTFSIGLGQWNTRTVDLTGATPPRWYQFVWEPGRTGTVYQVWYFDPASDWEIIWPPRDISATRSD